MSLTRKALSAMGIESEKIDSIISMHTETIDDMKGQIETLEKDVKTYKADAEKLSGVQKELSDLKEKVEADTKEREGKDYDALKKEFDDYKTAQENKAVRASKETAYKAILKDAGIPEKHFAKVLKYSDIDSLELDGEGKLKDSKELLKTIKEEWSDHIEQSSTKGAETATPPDNAGSKGKTKEEIMNIKDRAERQAAIAENPELFGIG